MGGGNISLLETGMPKETSELVVAAQKIETEQQRLEDLAYGLEKTKLQSEKHLGRAARELQDALAQQEQLAVSLRELGSAMAKMQERQLAAVTALSTRAQEIQTRRLRLAELMTEYATLGQKAAELLQTISDTLDAADKGAAVTAALDKLAPIVEESAALSKTAREEDFVDVAHEADVLKQKFQNIKNQLATAKTNAPN
jgi:chromosome segregation ATPase